MPEISRFFGMIIAIYYNDHLPPHFHVRYGGQDAVFSIEDLRLLEGKLSARARGLVVEWASQHQPELHQNWERARQHQPLESIAPLE